MDKVYPYDPELRDVFLKRAHKAPLIDRARAVFGDQAPEVLARLRAAWKNRGVGEFDSEARYIFRVCAKIVGPSEKRRRKAYLEARVADWHGDGEDCSQDPISLLAEKLGMKRRDLFPEYWKVLVAMGANEHRTLGIIRNATNKRNPLRYLRVVVRNEKLASKKRRGR